MGSEHQTVLASRVFKTGKQSLIACSNGKFYIRLENPSRTNNTTIEILPEKVSVWKALLGGK